MQGHFAKCCSLRVVIKLFLPLDKASSQQLQDTKIRASPSCRVSGRLARCPKYDCCMGHHYRGTWAGRYLGNQQNLPHHGNELEPEQASIQPFPAAFAKHQHHQHFEPHSAPPNRPLTPSDLSHVSFSSSSFRTELLRAKQQRWLPISRKSRASSCPFTTIPSTQTERVWHRSTATRACSPTSPPPLWALLRS